MIIVEEFRGDDITNFQPNETIFFRRKNPYFTKYVRLPWVFPLVQWTWIKVVRQLYHGTLADY